MPSRDIVSTVLVEVPNGYTDAEPGTGKLYDKRLGQLTSKWILKEDVERLGVCCCSINPPIRIEVSPGYDICTTTKRLIIDKQRPITLSARRA